MTTKTELRGRIRTGCRAMSGLCVLITVTGVLSGAESPFVGTWKLNPNLSQTVITFEPAPSGMIRYSVGGSNLRYTFTTDGAHKLLDSTGTGRVLGKQIDNSTWQMTRYNDQGEALWTDTWKLASDGQTLTTIETNARSNTPITLVSERVTGTGGLFGTWKWRLGGITYPDQIEIQPFGDDGLALISVEYAATCKAKFDEKDYTCTGSAVPAGMTMALKQTGPRTFEATSKQSGKLLFTDTYAVTPDGRRLVNESKPAGIPSPLAWWYDRQ
jgi:hypothetical protein